MGIGTPSFIQDAAITAWNDTAHVAQHRLQYKKKRDQVINALESINMKVFGGMGYKLQNGHMVDYETNVGFDGMLAFGNSIIEQVGKHEFYAYNEDRVFEADGNRITMTGGKSDVFKLKPPRNQLSVGPFVGVQYDQTTGLTEPVIGFGVTYNMLKIWDWK